MTFKLNQKIQKEPSRQKEQPIQKPRGREHNELKLSVKKKEWLEPVGWKQRADAEGAPGWTGEPDH